MHAVASTRLYFGSLSKRPIFGTDLECRELHSFIGNHAYDAAATELPLIAVQTIQRFFDIVRVERLIDDSAAPIRSNSGEVVGCVLVFRDVTDRRRKDQELEIREQQFRLLAESIPQLAWMANPDGHIFWYNRRWFDYTGTNFEQMEGWGWQSVHDPNLLPEVPEQWNRCIDNGDSFEMVFPLKHHEGAFRPFLTRIVPVKDSEGRVARWFGSCTDIYEQQQTQDQLRRLAADLSEADRRKDEFLATLAHELRNPLAAVGNGLQLMGIAGIDAGSVEKARPHRVALDPPAGAELVKRLESVHQVIYLLFNEGYSASHGEVAIRADLCEEAGRLCYMHCAHPRCNTPATHALMALMLFHAARLETRLDERGSIQLMEEQDRSRWDRGLICRANDFLNQAAEGTVVSPYHLEAAIAWHHCTAKCYAETDWPAILRLYDALLTIHRSPVYLLNRAIVVAHIDGPQAGIRELGAASQDASLRHYHLFEAALGELHRHDGDLSRARQYFEAVRRLTISPYDREIIERRLAMCGEK